MEAQAPEADPRSSSGTRNKESKYLLLLISLVVLTLVYPVQHYLELSGDVPGLKIVTLVVLIAGVHAACRKRWLRILGTVLWVLAAALGTVGEWRGPVNGTVFSVWGETSAMAALLLDAASFFVEDSV